MTATDDDYDGPPGDKKMPLLEHLIELRQRLMWSAVAFFIAFLVCYAFHKQIFSILIAPMNSLPNPEGRRMIFTAPTEAFFTYIKLAMWGAVCLSFPIVAAQVWKFVAPGLYQHEKNAFLPFLVATPFMFALGAAFLYFLILPYGLQFFASFEIPRDVAGPGSVPIQFEAKMNEYLSFVMALILAFGISFELPVLLVLLVKVGIVSTKQLASKRRYAVVGLVTFAAIVTPPDVFSQLALAVPMYLLYELAIVIGRLVETKEEDDEEEVEEPAGAKPAAATSAAPAAARPAAPRLQVFDENDFNLAR